MKVSSFIGRRSVVIGALLLLTAAAAGSAGYFIAKSESRQRHGGRLGCMTDGAWRPLAENPDDASGCRFDETVQWRRLSAGVSVGSLSLQREWWPHAFKTRLYRFKPGAFSFRVVPAAAAEEGWMFAEEAARAAGAAFAVNANFFSNRPLGLVIHEGRQISSRSSAMPGYFVVFGHNGAARVLVGRDVNLDGAREAAQSFPGLVADGYIPGYILTGLTERGRRILNVHEVARRAAAAETADGTLLFLLTDTLTGGLTFAELARVLLGLGAVNAVGLDGGGSAQAYLHFNGEEQIVRGKDRVPVVIVGFPAESAPSAAKEAP